jgi:hypothetical protein
MLVKRENLGIEGNIPSRAVRYLRDRYFEMTAMVAVTEGIHPHNSVHPVICNDHLATRFYSNAKMGNW